MLDHTSLPTIMIPYRISKPLMQLFDFSRHGVCLDPALYTGSSIDSQCHMICSSACFDRPSKGPIYK